jgi:hypothetical protein
MGLDMVYRYRPMRVFPRMTTGSIMSKGSFSVVGHYEGFRGASTAKADEIVSHEVIFLTLNYAKGQCVAI